MPSKRRRLNPTEIENDRLRMTIVQLRHEVETKQGYAAKLELVVRQRTETIDDLVGKLEQSREQCRRLGAECESYFRMLAAS